MQKYQTLRHVRVFHSAGQILTDMVQMAGHWLNRRLPLLAHARLNQHPLLLVLVRLNPLHLRLLALALLSLLHLLLLAHAQLNQHLRPLVPVPLNLLRLVLRPLVPVPLNPLRRALPLLAHVLPHLLYLPHLLHQ